MCTNKRWITNKYTGARFLASCGHCKACLQEKAISRSNRIRSEYDDHTHVYFGTLTYDPDSVPFVNYEDLQNRVEVLTVYRRSEVHWNANKQKHIKKRGMFPLYSVFTGIDEQDRYWFYRGFGKCRWLKHQPHKVGITYYKDFQDFIKRFRQNLFRHGLSIPHKFFGCSEYGEDTQRPHLHFLLFAQSSDVETLRQNVIAAWPYGRHIRHEKSFQLVTDDPASYVSSYVNSGSKFSSFLARNFAPKSSYSKLFGHHRDVFSLDSIQKCVDRHDMSFIVERPGAPESQGSCVRLPKYVINRWFPLFKGCSRLACDTVSNFIRSYFDEKFLRSYTRYYDAMNPRFKIDISKDDAHKISVRFRNTFQAFQESTGIKNVSVALDYYAELYNRVWILYKNTLYRYLLEDDSCHFLYKYDNFCLMRPHRRRRAVESMPCHDSVRFVLDPNEYPPVVNRSNTLSNLYDVYCKNKEITNIVMSENGIFV